MLLLRDERTDALVLRPARPWERFLAGVRTHHLDEELAHGASP
jgi:predicted secreted Zn-dependent protease